MTSGLMTHGPWVSDEVWRSLDPHAGRLSRRARRALWLFEVALLVAVALLFGALASGVGKARVSMVMRSSQALTGSRPGVATLELSNRGSVAATISKVTADHGLTVTSTRGLPVHIKPHSQVTVTVYLAITDCAATRQEAPEIAARVEQFWGHWSKTTPAYDTLLPTVVGRACPPTR